VSGSNVLLQAVVRRSSVDYPGARLRCSYSENLSTELLRTFSASELMHPERSGADEWATP
jgi:hypothetical protein